MSNNVITLPQFDEMLAVYLEYGDIFNNGMIKFEQLCSDGIPIDFDETDRIFQEHESTLIDGNIFSLEINYMMFWVRFLKSMD